MVTPVQPPSEAPANETWTAGLPEELLFWDEWLATRGGQWPEAFAERLNPARPLQPFLEELLAAQGVTPGKPARILDVGAGPVTFVGYRSATWALELTAVDPLAAEYDKLLVRHGVQPPVRTQPGDAELLAGLFPPNHFHVVTARNCIDHTWDPLRALEAMLDVCAPGGTLLLQHAVNEAERQGWHGLHQWNLTDVAGELILAGREQRVNVTRARAAVRNELHYKGEWLVTWITKHRRPWLDALLPRRRGATVLVDDPTRWLPQ